MIYWFFGYPGIGKDHSAKKLSVLGKFPHVDADDFLTEEDKEKLLSNTFSKEDRLLKLGRIVQHLQSLLRHHEHIAVADSLPDNVSRLFILNSFPGKIKLVLVTADETTHKKRLAKRKNHFFTEELLDNYIKKNWEKVTVSHIEYDNGRNSSEEELLKLL